MTNCLYLICVLFPFKYLRHTICTVSLHSRFDLWVGVKLKKEIQNISLNIEIWLVWCKSPSSSSKSWQDLTHHSWGYLTFKKWVFNHFNALFLPLLGACRRNICPKSVAIFVFRPNVSALIISHSLQLEHLFPLGETKPWAMDGTRALPQLPEGNWLISWPMALWNIFHPQKIVGFRKFSSPIVLLVFNKMKLYES